MADIIQIRRDTAANWTSANPTLAQGELGVETDTDKIKIGDGSTAWASLGYLIDTGGYAPLASPTFTGTVTADALTVDGDISLTGGSDVQSDGTLNIKADQDGSGAGVLRLTTNAKTRQQIDNNGDISFYEDTGTTPKFFWDASAESLGIGTTSPQYLGHFVDGDIAIVDTDATNNAEKQSLLFGGATGESAGLAGITGYRGASASEGELIFKTNQGSGITEAMRIDNNGNVGIGTDSPTEKLDVTGTVKATNYTDTVYALSGTALDPANGGIQTKTLAANTTFTDSLASGESLVLQLEAGASYTVTWPTMTWVTSSGNTAPTLTAKDTLVFWKVSTTLYGAYTGSYV